MTQQEDIIVLGGGDVCRQILSVLSRNSKYRVVAIIDSKVSGSIQGIPVYATEQYLLALKIYKGCIAIGDNGVREEVAQKVLALYPDFQFVNVIDSHACISDDVVLGVGVCVLSGAIIQNGCRIGSHVLIGSAAIIEHDNVISDFCSIGPGACTGGNVVIEHAAVLGIRATVLQGRHIGKYAILGAQALLTENLSAYMVAVGLPAKPIRKREPRDSYL